MEKGKEAKFLKNKSVLVVDDVLTTGSTLYETLRVLKELTSNNIYAAVCAVT